MGVFNYYHQMQMHAHAARLERAVLYSVSKCSNPLSYEGWLCAGDSNLERIGIGRVTLAYPA